MNDEPLDDTPATTVVEVAEFRRASFVLVGTLTVFALLAAGILVGAGLRGSDATPMAGKHPTAVAPLDLATVSPELAAQFTFAKAHADTFAQVPCYCGCEKFLAHRNLEDCFVRADGRGWEAHAAGCGVCQAEGTAVQSLIGEGKGPPEIRTAVIARYGAVPSTAPTTTTSY